MVFPLKWKMLFFNTACSYRRDFIFDYVPDEHIVSEINS